MPLSAADRLDIRDLLIRYEFASRTDKSDERSSYLKIFTEDAILDGPRGYYEGIDGILAFDRQVRPTDGTKKARTRSTNFLIEGDGDHATMKCCWYKIIPRDGAPPEIRTGTYDCIARKEDGVWKLAHRIIRIDGMPQFKDTPAFNSSQRYVLHGDDFVLEDVNA